MTLYIYLTIKNKKNNPFLILLHVGRGYNFIVKNYITSGACGPAV